MAFSFGTPGGTGPSIQKGPDLPIIQTEALGFLSIAVDSKVRLLPSPWPTDNLPKPTSSLLAVASQKGIIAAAGPDAVVIATTESVRKAYDSPDSGDNGVRSFQPQLTLPMPMRISHVVISADENYLVLSAEVGGGLAVYDAQSLLRGSRDTTFELSTNSASLRALVPNPTAAKGELFAAVTTDGKLLMANLKEKSIVSGPNGPVLKEGVSCVCWSYRGKQLLAGLGDGTLFQLTPEGEGKGEIPRPPDVNGDYHVSSISWLENDIFLAVHTSSNANDGMAPESVFHIVTRQKQNFQFQKITDPAGPFGLARWPPHHFLLRLRDFPPNLQDALVVASTASTDIGLLTRSKIPLVADQPAVNVTSVFTMTEMADDTRRAQLPMNDEMNDTSPIGVALDLSAKEKVARPIPGDEMNESPTPVPLLMVLNNEGILVSWWFIYTDSIREGTIYPGLAAAETSQSTPGSSVQQSSPFSRPATSSTFGQPAFGSPSHQQPFSGFSKPPLALGASQAPDSSSSSAFGATSGLNKNPSPWAAMSSKSTAPAFGAPSSLGSSTSAFGASGIIGTRASPWASIGSGGPVFGQSGILGSQPLGAPTTEKPAAGVFGSSSTNPQSSALPLGGFASFAGKGSFAAAAAQTTGNTLSLGESSGFAAPVADREMETSTDFGVPSKEISGSNTISNTPFSSSPFNLGSTFKADKSGDDNEPQTSNAPKSSLFSASFGGALSETQATPTQVKSPTTQPAETSDAAPFKNDNATALRMPVITSESDGTEAAQSVSKGTGTTSSNFFETAMNSAAQLPATSSQNDAMKLQPMLKSPVIKTEAPPEDEVSRIADNIPEAPLPPDPTSKAMYAAGGSSESSAATTTVGTSAPDKVSTEAGANVAQPQKEAAQPSDTTTTYSKAHTSGDNESDYLADDGEQGNFAQSEEGSGEDVAKDLSPVSDNDQTPGFTPQSSFGGAPKASDDEMFTKISRPGQPSSSRSLFGEIGQHNIPSLPPIAKIHASPRSPSPVRSSLPNRLFRPEASRSFSAPGVASMILSSQAVSQDAVSTKSSFALSIAQRQQLEKERAESAARKEVADAQALIDMEDNEMEEFLTSDVVGTKTLDDFVAHQDYVGNADRSKGVPAHVEIVYRDINSMIDTMGINSRSLLSFIKGQSEASQQQAKTPSDLDNSEDWSLAEIGDLSRMVEVTLWNNLEDGKIRVKHEKVDECNSIAKDLARLRARYGDVKKLGDVRVEADQTDRLCSQPLNTEQAAQQSDLRRDFVKFQKLLAQSEESLVLLKTKLASESGGKKNVEVAPTVEAVTKTIRKMTSMAEKRSGDIDVLENQMRKLRFSSLTSARSREGSPFAASQSRLSARNGPSSSTFSLSYASDDFKESPRGLRASMASSFSDSPRATPPRKKVGLYTQQEKGRLRDTLARKEVVADRLKTALQKSGTQVRPVDDD